MESRVWSEDENGELWLDNPHLALVNPRKRRKGKRKGTMPAGLKRYWAARRGGGGRKAASPRRRRRAAAAVTHYRARRNPGGGRWGGLFGGLNIKTVGGVVAGFAAPRFIMPRLTAMMPEAVMSNTWGYWAVKLGAALLPGWAVKMVKRDFGVNMMIGGAASFVLDGISAYSPGLLSGMGAGQPMLGYYSAGMLASAPSVTSVPARLGQYGMRNGYPPAQPQRDIIATVSSRLNPANRF